MIGGKRPSGLKGFSVAGRKWPARRLRLLGKLNLIDFPPPPFTLSILLLLPFLLSHFLSFCWFPSSFILYPLFPFLILP